MTGRALLRIVHLWLGLGLLLPLVVVSVSGSILVLRHEIAELIEPKRAAVIAGPIRSIAEIVRAAASAVPDSQPALVLLPLSDTEPATVRFTRGPTDVAIDPTSLAVLDVKQPGGFLRAMHRLHGSLMITGGVGRQIVGWLGVVMLVLGFSGLVMWWPKPGQVHAALTVARGAGGYRFHRQLHGALGIWCWLVFIVVSFSGVYLAFPQPIGEFMRTAFSARDVRTGAAGGVLQPLAGVAPMDVDAAAALALTAAPEARLWTVRYPARADQPFRIAFVRADHAPGQPPITIAIDPYRASIVSRLDPSDFTAGETLIAWQRAVHAGDGLGWSWKLLVFLSGLLPVAFGATGFAMWRAQRRAKRPNKQRIRLWAS